MQQIRPGDTVRWKAGVPPAWRVIHAPGPFAVVSVRPSPGGVIRPYASAAVEGFALEYEPGRVCRVRHYRQAGGYYDPDFRFLAGRWSAEMDVHEMWLEIVEAREGRS